MNSNNDNNNNIIMMMDEFKAGVTACLRSWSALRTAVESGWGGGTNESNAKAEDLRQSIFDIMNGQKCPIPNFELEDLQDNLAIYMEEEFSVTLEDGSERQVAQVIFQMYEQCYNGNPTMAQQLVQNASKAVALSSQHQSQVVTTEHDDDDDDDDDDRAMMDTNDDDDQNNTQVAPTLISLPKNSNNNSTATTLPSSAGTAAAVASSSVPDMTFTSASEYAAAPLFGPVVKRGPSSLSSKPVRQLGESVPEEPVMEVDDDGFAPVKSNRRKR